MIYRIIFFIFAIFLALPPLALADIKIGVFDVMKANDESLEFKFESEKIKKRYDEFNEQAEKAQDDIFKKRDQLIKKQNVISIEDYKKEEEKFASYADSKEKEFGNKRMQIDKDIIALKEKFEYKTKTILEDIAKEQKLDIIFERDKVTIYNPSLDITNHVIKKLNGEFKKSTN